jgi:DNA-binding NtrC family response regulator
MCQQNRRFAMNRKRILIVEDDDYWLRKTLQALHGLEVDFRIAKDWRKATEDLVEDEIYDLFIFDNNLGPITNAGVSLIETASLIYHSPPPAIVHSSDLMLQVAERVKELGAQYIKKSQDGSVLRNAVERLLSLTSTPSP